MLAVEKVETMAPAAETAGMTVAAAKMAVPATEMTVLYAVTMVPDEETTLLDVEKPFPRPGCGNDKNDSADCGKGGNNSTSSGNSRNDGSSSKNDGPSKGNDGAGRINNATGCRKDGVDAEMAKAMVQAAETGKWLAGIMNSYI